MNTVPATTPQHNYTEMYPMPQNTQGLTHIGRSWDAELGMWWPIIERTPEQIAESKRLTDLSNAQPSMTAADLDEKCTEVHNANMRSY